MAGLVDAARLLWCHGLQRSVGNPDQTMHEWLSTANFTPVAAGKSVVLTRIDPTSFVSALSCDLNRLSSAASETLRNIADIPAVPKSMAWPYVKLYYSALFYAHSLLRVWGRSPSYLRTIELLHIRNTLNAYNVTPPLPLKTGQFLLIADLAQQQVTLTSDSVSGGSHEAVWRELNRTMIELKNAVAASQFTSGDKAQIDAQIVAAMRILSRGNTNISWPSMMRNDINYRQAEGLWYPYAGRAKTSEIVSAITTVTSGARDFDSLLRVNGSDLQVFRSACLFVVSFAREVLADLATIGGPKSFLKYGQSRFETAYP